MLRTFLITTALAACVAAGAAQSRNRESARTGTTGCDDYRSDDRASFCEVREDTIGGANPLDLDSGGNGGIRVHGWDRGDVLVRTRVVASANTDDEARRVASAVRLETGGGRIRATGPEPTANEHWSVGFELFVPRAAMLTLNTRNGGISLEDFRGSAEFHTQNGGLSLARVGGNLRGTTTNGGVAVDLDGDHWDGAGLDLETRNGGIRVSMPGNYSAEVEAGTTRGGLNVDFPVAERGQRHVTATLGAGGPKIRTITTNGGVTIRRRP